MASYPGPLAETVLWNESWFLLLAYGTYYCNAVDDIVDPRAK